MSPVSAEPAPQDWTFTFCDMVTRRELAVLPLTGVKYSRQLSGAGKLDAYLTLTDPQVRALNPWAATRQRKTALFVEYGDRCVWAGPVISRERSGDSVGMSITAITYEGWLARQRLVDNLSVTAPTRTLVTQLVAAAQAVTDVGLTVATGDPGLDRNWTFLAREVKPITQILEDVSAAGPLGSLPGNGAIDPLLTKIEYRIDAARDASGVFAPVMVIGEPRLGRRFESTALGYSWPDGGLTSWTLTEDGSGTNNVLPYLGSGSGDYQPFDVLFDRDAGIYELDSGFPSWMADFRAQDSSDLTWVRGRAVTAMRAGAAGEFLLSGVNVRAPRYLADGLLVGDDLGLEVTHPSFEEYPGAVTYVTRLLGENVTVGSGGKGDAVSLTIGGTP